jgi:hypothetical protein
VAQIDERLKDASRPLSPEGRGQLERMAAWIRSEIAELPALKPVVPNVTFDTSLTLYRGSREIRLLHFGPGNSARSPEGEGVESRESRVLSRGA